MNPLHGPFERDGARWWLRDDLDPDRWLASLERVRAAVERGAFADLKTGRRKSLFAIPEPNGGADVLWRWKRNGHRGVLRASRLVGPSRSRHELRLAERLAAHGVPCVVPLAVAEERRYGTLHTCHLVVEHLGGATDLLQLAATPALTAKARRGLAVELGQLARAAFDAGIRNDDFTPNNVLVAPDSPRLRLIDFERARLAPRPVPAEQRAAMLAKLARALPDSGSGERMRCVLALVGGQREAARALFRAAQAAARRLARRDLRRAQRIATKDGRRWVALTLPRVGGVARRELDAQTLARIVNASPGPTPDGTIVPLAHDEHAARLVFARCHALAARGLCVRPLALFESRDGWRLLLDRNTACGDRVGGAESARPDPASLRVLQRRLDGLGSLADGAPSDAVALATTPRGAHRAIVLDPRWLAPGAATPVPPFRSDPSPSDTARHGRHRRTADRFDAGR